MSNITINIKGKTKSLIYKGTAFWGEIYIAENEPFCYRLIPIEDVRSLELREQLISLKNNVRKTGVAPVKDVIQTEVNNSNYLLIIYDIDPEIVWADVLENKPPEINLIFSSAVLKMLNKWWSYADSPLAILPNEVVFVDGNPFWLQFPFIGLPKISNLLSEPERILYLPPEVFKNKKNQIEISQKNIDLYILGVSILKGLYKSEKNINSEKLIQSKLSNTDKMFHNCEKRLPFWAEKVAFIQSVYNYTKQTTETDIKKRSYVEPNRLADFIEKKLRYFEPIIVIKKLIEQNQIALAYDIIQDVLIENETYELLIIAGKIASEELNLPLEAIEFFEKAINKKPDNPQAYIEQINILTKNTTFLIFDSLLQKKNHLAKKIDNMIWRDFYKIDRKSQENVVVNAGKYYVAINKFDKASDMLYDFLFDENQTYLWWKFDRTILYAKCLLGMKRLDEAAGFIADIKQKLLKVKQENRLEPQLIHAFGKELSQLEILLFELRK